MECKFCKSTFINKYKLERHQRTAQFCLELQKTDVQERTCNLCRKVYSSEKELKVHKCKGDENDFVKETIVRLLQRIDILEERLDMLTKPEISLLPLTKAYISEAATNLSLEEHIKTGSRGYAEFACEHVFNNRLVCTDVSRRHFKYRTEHGDLLDDYGLLKVVPMFFSAIEEKNRKIINDYKIAKLAEIDSEDLEEYEYEQFSTLISYKTELKEAIEGERTRFVEQFVKTVAMTTKS